MFGLLRKKKLLVTHNGSFHADDVFACAALEIYLNARGAGIRILRSRDQADFARGDFVFDVGGVYDPATNRFDHHQQGGAGKRPNGISYAAFGLVWKTYGSQITSVWQDIDDHFVTPIDAHDNGEKTFEPNDPDVLPVEAAYIVSLFNPTWKETQDESDKRFRKLVTAAREILVRVIKKFEDKVEGHMQVELAYEAARHKEIIVLDQYLPWSGVLKRKDDTVYVVYSQADSWRVQAVEAEKFKPRKPFPSAWLGLERDALREASHVSDALFAHPKGFLVGAKSRDGAIALAKKALEG